MAFKNLFSRIAGINALAELDDRSLNDIGLDRHDLSVARSKGAGASSYLNNRRAERAEFWLR